MDRILGFFDQAMLIDWGLQLINTAVLFTVLAWLLYVPVKNFMKNRSERIQSQIATAETDLKQAHALRAQYEQKLNEIDKERNEILETSRKQALAKHQEIIAEARAEADMLKNRAMLDIQREEERSKDDMRKQMIEISTLMASRFVASSIDQTTQNKLLEDVISDLGDAKWLS